jgi:hypothetical protein
VQEGQEALRPGQALVDVEQAQQRHAAALEHVAVRLEQPEADREHHRALDQVHERDHAHLAARVQVQGVLELFVGLADRVRMVLHRGAPFAANQR